MIDRSVRIFLTQRHRGDLLNFDCCRHRVCKFSAKVTTISSLVVHANAESSIKADDVGSVLVSVHAKNSSEVSAHIAGDAFVVFGVMF